MSTFLFLAALFPIVYLIIAASNVRRFFTEPSRTQVYSVLRFRWHLLGLSWLLWLIGLVVVSLDAGSILWLTYMTGFLLVILLPVSLFLSGCRMFSAVKEAKFLAPSEIDARLSPDDPVIGLEINGESHAYPIKWIQQPQIVEDIIGGTPVVVTYSRHGRHGKKALAFSAEFKLNSLRLIYPPYEEENVMLYDASSKRLVKQMSGEIIFGPGKGSRIPTLPLRIVPWVTWESLHPKSKVFYHELKDLDRKPWCNMVDWLKAIRADLKKDRTVFNTLAKL